MICSWGGRAPPPGLTVSVLVSLWQVMVTNVTSLLKTVKAVEDEATRGTRALEATIECIKQELTVRAQTSSLWSFESQPMRHRLSAKLPQRGSGISVSIILNITGKLFVLFFPLLSVQLLPSSFPLGPCRFLTALIRFWVAGAGRVRKEEDFKSLLFCNLLLILIRGPPAWEEKSSQIQHSLPNS